MQLKVLLVNPPSSAAATAAEAPPLGLGYLFSAVMDLGHDVRILDLAAEGSLAQEFETTVRSFAPDIVGFSVTTPQMGSFLDLARIVREISRRTLTLAGGSHPSILPERTLDEAAGNLDLVVCGEGEETFREIVAGGDPAGMRGVACRQDGRVRVNAPRPLMQNLDQYALHDRDMFRWQRYPGFYPRGTGADFGLVSSRGCPYACRFCASANVFGRTFRRRSVQSVVREIGALVRKYGAQDVTFFDDQFTADHSWIERFCGLLLEADLGVGWKCFSRVDKVNPDLLALMKKAGCWMICYGAESGDETVLKRMDKRASLAQARRAFEDTRKAGIKTLHFYMIGNEGERSEDFRSTIGFAESVRPDVYQLGIALPFPGAKWYDQYEAIARERFPRYDYNLGRFGPQEQVSPGCPLTLGEMRDLIGQFKRRMNAVGSCDWRQFTSLGRSRQYACEISAELDPAGRLQIRARNTGLSPWSEAQQVRIGVRIAAADGRPISEGRMLLERNVEPGDSIMAEYIPPAGGGARLHIDMVKEREFWFSDLNGRSGVELTVP